MPHLTGVEVENRRDLICTASLFGLFRSHDLLSTIHVESLIIDTKRWLSVVRSFPLLASLGGTTGPGSSPKFRHLMRSEIDARLEPITDHGYTRW